MQVGHKLRQDSNVKTLGNWGKTTVIKINGKEIKEVDKFIYSGNAMENIGKIQIKIYETIGKVSEFFLLDKSLL